MSAAVARFLPPAFWRVDWKVSFVTETHLMLDAVPRVTGEGLLQSAPAVRQLQPDFVLGFGVHRDGEGAHAYIHVGVIEGVDVGSIFRFRPVMRGGERE